MPISIRCLAAHKSRGKAQDSAKNYVNTILGALRAFLCSWPRGFSGRMRRQQDGKHMPRDIDTFRFVNVRRPADASQDDDRRQIRSHVSKWHYRKAQERLRDNASGPSERFASGQETPAGPFTHSACHPNSSEANPPWGLTGVEEKHVSAAFGSGFPHALAKSEHFNSVQQADFCKNAQVAIEGGRTEQDACRSTSNKPTRSFSGETVSFSTSTLNDPENIVGTILNALELDLSSVLVGRHLLGRRAAANSISGSLPK